MPPCFFLLNRALFFCSATLHVLTNNCAALKVHSGSTARWQTEVTPRGYRWCRRQCAAPTVLLLCCARPCCALISFSILATSLTLANQPDKLPRIVPVAPTGQSTTVSSPLSRTTAVPHLQNTWLSHSGNTWKNYLIKLKRKCVTQSPSPVRLIPVLIPMLGLTGILSRWDWY